LNKQEKKHRYLELLPKLRRIARRHGYALAVHGSMQRDFDLVAIPWVDKFSRPLIFLDAIMKAIDGTQGTNFGVWKPNGRKAYSIQLPDFLRTGMYLDISIPACGEHIDFRKRFYSE